MIALDLRALESLLAFWGDAGVHEALDDAPHDRLSEGEARARIAALANDAPLPAPTPRSVDWAETTERAREAALAADSLQALTLAIARFDGPPPLGGPRPSFVARGAPDAAVVVVGEAPGAEEETEGRGFAGRAGALLDRALAAAGLSDRALLTYTVFRRPSGDRSPTPQECVASAPFLDRLIALTSPRALLVLGAGPARALLRRDEPIRTLRGQWMERTSDDGALTLPALATLSPAFLLSQPEAKRLFWADLLALAARLDGPSADARG